MPPRDSERRFVLHDHTTNSNEQANWTVPLRYYRTTTPVHRRRTTPPSPPLIMAQPIHPSSVLTVTAATTAAAFVASTLHGDKDKKLPAGTQKATMVSILCHPQRIWELHIMISCLVLLVGILQNHNTRWVVSRRVPCACFIARVHIRVLSYTIVDLRGIALHCLVLLHKSYRHFSSLGPLQEIFPHRTFTNRWTLWASLSKCLIIISRWCGCNCLLYRSNSIRSLLPGRLWGTRFSFFF